MTKMRANPTMAEVLRVRQAEADRLQARIEAERAEANETRAHIRAVVDREPADEVEAVDRGPTRLLARDGLLWLVAKKRITAAQRMAAERYRTIYAVLFASPIRSCIADTIGSAPGDALTVAKANARQALDRARKIALADDLTMIRLVDEVAGKGSTIRDLAGGDKHRADTLEVELKVALRLLARHFGFAT